MMRVGGNLIAPVPLTGSHLTADGVSPPPRLAATVDHNCFVGFTLASCMAMRSIKRSLSAVQSNGMLNRCNVEDGQLRNRRKVKGCMKRREDGREDPPKPKRAE